MVATIINSHSERFTIKFRKSSSFITFHELNDLIGRSKYKVSRSVFKIEDNGRSSLIGDVDLASNTNYLEIIILRQDD